MSNIQYIDDFLQHYGKKGMRWGSRKGKTSNKSSKSNSLPKAKDLSDEDLKKAVGRMQMEKQYNQLTGNKDKSTGRAVKAGAAFVSGIALNVARETIKNQATQKVATTLAKKASKT